VLEKLKIFEDFLQLSASILKCKITWQLSL